MKYNGTLAHKTNHDFDNNVKTSNVSSLLFLNILKIQHCHFEPYDITFIIGFNNIDSIF